jgi:hypothetical protein
MRRRHPLTVFALSLALFACGGDPALYPTSAYDGPWCLSMSGECGSALSDLTLSGGVISGTIDVEGNPDIDPPTCDAGAVPVTGIAYPQSSASAMPVDFAAVNFSGSAAAVGAFAYHGALSAAGGSGDWWNNARLSGIFSLTPGPCTPAP